ncbi:MAG TPA: hypothetical protein VEH49_04320 [Methylomirabilota bacterium]|nr:hypothetical protein [Methylomirabilota bacterium]
MASHPNYVKKQIAIDTVSWTPVVAPIDCMGVAIKNAAAADMKIRTDSGDPATQDTIPAGNQDGIMVGRFGDTPSTSRSGPRFFSGETVAYLQAVSGTGPALATFVA